MWKRGGNAEKHLEVIRETLGIDSVRGKGETEATSGLWLW